jgi:hypothetical protein
VANSLVRFWNEAKLDQIPILHPQDKISRSRIQDGITSFSDFVDVFKKGTLSNKALHLSLLPQPYLGDLDNADIIILLRNPGLSACDYYAEGTRPDYRKTLQNCIRQTDRRHAFLDPKWSWTTGFGWWEKKLRKVAQRIASDKFDGHYGRALFDMSQRVASIEMMPYHSFGYGGIKNLASATAAREFVSSLDDSRTVIVSRGVSDWALPEKPNIIKYSTGHARSASLGPDTAGGKAILRSYGIEE